MQTRPLAKAGIFNAVGEQSNNRNRQVISIQTLRNGKI